MLNVKNIEVSTELSILETYSRDVSNFKLVPKAVFFPKSTEEVQEVIRLAKEEGVSVSVRAGGTCMSGGSLNTGYILDLTRYMNEVKIDAVGQTASVGAGAYFRDIEDAAKEYGLFFAGYPSSNRRCKFYLSNECRGQAKSQP